jgi:RNA polymerase sigma-70 factor (ECF subfamily)
MELRMARDVGPPPRPVEQCVRGAETFEDFYRVHAERVYRALVVTLADVHLAKEATDEAMARAYARWDSLARMENPGGWVYRVALNWATSWWRKVRRERPLSLGYERSGQVDAGAAEALDALAGLGVQQRAVIVCRVLLDMTTAQTAAALGVAEGTVKSRLARSLATLRSSMTKEADDAD